MSGGKLTMRESNLSKSNGGGFYLGGGELHLVSSIIEKCASTRDGSILYVPANLPGLGPVFVATFTQFRTERCTTKIFKTESAAQIVLRDINFDRTSEATGSSCGTTDLDSTMFSFAAPLLDCGGNYNDIAGNAWGVCSSSSGGACSQLSVPGTALPSIGCVCPSPEFVHPSHRDPGFAPYQQTGGCVTPMRMMDFDVTSKEVTYGLSKPTSMVHTVNVTVHMRGDDVDSPANWTIVNSSLVLDRLLHRDGARWVQFPAGASGGTDADAIKAAFPSTAPVTVTLELSASGLRERAESYKEVLPIYVYSNILSVASRLDLDVALTIQVETSYAVWGRVNWDASVKQHCVRKAQITLGDGTSVDEVRRVAFTACDAENIPVDHPLPRAPVNEVFDAALVASSQEESFPIIEYAGSGIYEVFLIVPTPGDFLVTLQLGSAVLTSLTGAAECRQGRERTADGRSCGCPAGTRLRVIDDQCELCPVGYTATVGATECDLIPATFISFADSSSTSRLPCAMAPVQTSAVTGVATAFEFMSCGANSFSVDHSSFFFDARAFSINDSAVLPTPPTVVAQTLGRYYVAFTPPLLGEYVVTVYRDGALANPPCVLTAQ